MAELISQKLHDYFDELEAALALNADQSRGIVDEVRADLMARVAERTSQGETEQQAVSHTLEELGRPRELAQSIRSEVPPLSAPAIRYARYALSGLLVSLFLWLMWSFRSLEWGFSGLRVLSFIAFFLPVFLLAWPAVVWRKDWLFSFIPTIAAFAVVMLAMTVGTETTTQTIPLNPDQIAHVQAVHPGDPSHSAVRPMAYVALAVFVVLTVYLLAMIQRRRQLILALTLPLLAVLAIELPFYVEESGFREDVLTLGANMDAYQTEHVFLPTQAQYAELAAEWGIDERIAYRPSEDAQTYSLFLGRPLQTNASMCYDSEHGWYWVND